MGVLNELPQKAVPRVVDRGLVGHGIDDQSGAVMVAGDHLLQLIFGVVQSLRVFPLDVPVNRHLGPDHYSHLVCHTQHRFVVRIVRQPDEVATQLFGPSQQCLGIVVAPCAAGAQRRLFMKIDATQENRLSVKQDVRAFGFYRAKSDALGYLVGLAGNLNLVKLRVFRRPKSEVCVKRNVGASLGVGLELLAESRFGNSDGDTLLQFRSAQLHPAFDIAR